MFEITHLLIATPLYCNEKPYSNHTPHAHYYGYKMKLNIILTKIELCKSNFWKSTAFNTPFNT